MGRTSWLKFERRSKFENIGLFYALITIPVGL